MLEKCRLGRVQGKGGQVVQREQGPLGLSDLRGCFEPSFSASKRLEPVEIGERKTHRLLTQLIRRLSAKREKPVAESFATNPTLQGSPLGSRVLWSPILKWVGGASPYDFHSHLISSSLKGIAATVLLLQLRLIRALLLNCSELVYLENMALPKLTIPRVEKKSPFSVSSPSVIFLEACTAARFPIMTRR